MAGPPRTDFSSLYRGTLTPLRRFLVRMLGNRDDAADLAHDAYARVYRAMGARPLDHPKAFLFTTARNLALNHIRRRRAAPVQDADGSKIIEFTPADAPAVQHVVMARQDRARLDAAIAGLPPGCRQVLLMCKLEQRSHDEISAALGIAVSTVEKHHARALRLLRVAMQEEERKPENRSAEADATAGRNPR